MLATCPVLWPPLPRPLLLSFFFSSMMSSSMMLLPWSLRTCWSLSRVTHFRPSIHRHGACTSLRRAVLLFSRPWSAGLRGQALLRRPRGDNGGEDSTSPLSSSTGPRTPLPRAPVSLSSSSFLSWRANGGRSAAGAEASLGSARACPAEGAAPRVTRSARTVRAALTRTSEATTLRPGWCQAKPSSVPSASHAEHARHQVSACAGDARLHLAHRDIPHREGPFEPVAKDANRATYLT